MVLSRSSNWPRYLVPATISERSSAENPLVGKEAGHLAIGDALGEAFDNGRLAHAGLADQHRIVFGAAAEDLDDALQLAITAYERVQLPVHRGLRQITAELGQQARLALPLLLRGLLLGYARQLFANLREFESTLLQDLRSKAFFFAQEAKKQVFRTDMLVPQAFGFFRRIGQDALAFIREG